LRSDGNHAAPPFWVQPGRIGDRPGVWDQLPEVLVEVEDDTVLVPSGAVELVTDVVDWPVITPSVCVVVVVVVVVDWPTSAQAASEAAAAHAMAAKGRIRERMLDSLFVYRRAEYGAGRRKLARRFNDAVRKNDVRDIAR